MNEKYAIHPECFDTAIELKYLIEKFGFSQGRYIAEYPKAWKRLVIEHTSSFSELERYRVKRILELAAREALLRLSVEYDSEKTWCQNALEKKALGHFADVIANDEKGAVPLDSIDETYFSDSRGTQTLATAENLVRLLHPLLQKSHEIYVVDPYLSLGKKGYVRFVTALLESPTSAGKAFHFFSLDQHFRCKESIESLYRRELLPYHTAAQKLSFYSIGTDEHMHGRYIFSVVGGLKYDKGFQCNENIYVDIEAMSNSLRDIYQRKYCENRDLIEIQQTWHF